MAAPRLSGCSWLLYIWVVLTVAGRAVACRAADCARPELPERGRRTGQLVYCPELARCVVVMVVVVLWLLR